MTTETTTPTRAAAIPDDRLVWLDLETTGLDPDEDGILELAIVVTNADLTEVARASWVTDTATEYNFADLDPVVQRMHGSGLWCESLVSDLDVSGLDFNAAAFVREHAGEGALIAGNSIHFDVGFMAEYMPETLATLHRRQLNVSSLNELARRAWPSVYATRPSGTAHRALADALSSIEQARHYSNELVPAPSDDARRGLEVLCGRTFLGTVGDGIPEAIRWIGAVVRGDGGEAPRSPSPPIRHDLYKTGDKDAPDQIKDGNGEVALGCCRRCGEGEGTLAASCPGPKKFGPVLA